MIPGSEFQIQPNHLDREWRNQPTLMHDHCLRLADAKQQLNSAKSNLEVVEAEEDREVRMHPSRYGIDKLSETRIKNAVILSPSYREAAKEVIRLQHAVDVLQAAVSALDHKKRALENLVHLHAMSYYSEPQTNEDAYDAMREEARGRALRPKAPKKREK